MSFLVATAHPLNWSLVMWLIYLQTVNVNIEHVRIGEGCEVLVEEAIDTAEKNEGWVVIEDLHLAPDKFFYQLKKQLIRVFRSREKLRGKVTQMKCEKKK